MQKKFELTFNYTCECGCEIKDIEAIATFAIECACGAEYCVEMLMYETSKKGGNQDGK